MYKAIFGIEVITPLMMSSGEIMPGGTYPKDKKNEKGQFYQVTYNKKLKNAELRVPSIKGVMRWWFRAITGLADIKQLKKLEDDIFGSTEGGSKVKIRIENVNLEEPVVWKGEWWKEYECSEKINGKKYINGYRYLSYTNFVEASETKTADVRKFINPGDIFNLIITSLDKSAIEFALISLWFAIHFGSFGNRARRGFGRLQTIAEPILSFSSDCLTNFSFFHNGSLEDYKETLKKGINAWREHRSRLINHAKPTNKYTNVINAKMFFIENKAKYDCKPNLDKMPFNKWQLALNEAGKRFQCFRQSYPDDKTEILKGYTGNDIKKIDISKLKKPVLGLPIVYKKYNGITVKRKEDKERGIGDRFASPVWISVHKIGKNYYPAFLFMFSNPAQGMKITVNGKDGNFSNNNTVFDEFIKQQFDGITPIEFKL